MDHKHHDSHHGHHIVPLKVYFLTLAALIVLTVVTVGASYIDFGRANFAVALSIATFKASLVMLFFMGLKYDNNLNRAFILSSFFALALLVFFTAVDLFSRLKPQPVKVVSAMAALSTDEFEKLMQSSPEQLAKGKEVYNVNCAVCHGADGKGDGVGGASLNPRPRNFHSAASEWKNGNSVKAIYVTLAYGINGGGMAAYKSLPVQDRLALAHYVQSFSSAPEKKSKGDERFALAVKEDGIGAAGAASAPKNPLPIDFAIERISNN
jgi:caa(3)-type oxidase subunit IV